MAKAAKEIPVTATEIQDRYIDYVLTHNEEPKSVYEFSKKLGITEAEFYNYFASFSAIEKTVWSNLTTETILGVTSQEIWDQYSSREKMLSFFFAYIELLKSRRSFIIYTFKKNNQKFSLPSALHDAKIVFETFAESVINEGLETKELAERRYISKRYKDALWVQFKFILDFWIYDDSNNFEKTDEAIEKGVNLAFDLFQRSPLDNMVEYGKFLFRNGHLKEKLRF